jgi:hypothetical protein
VDAVTERLERRGGEDPALYATKIDIPIRLYIITI